MYAKFLEAYKVLCANVIYFYFPFLLWPCFLHWLIVILLFFIYFNLLPWMSRKSIWFCFYNLDQTYFVIILCFPLRKLLLLFWTWKWINTSENIPDFVHIIYNDFKSNIETALCELSYFVLKAIWGSWWKSTKKTFRKSYVFK